MKVKGGHILYLVIILISLASCAKGGIDSGETDAGTLHVYSPTDSIAPTLEIYTPVSSQSFVSGGNISVTGKISDDLGLYQGSIRITNDATGELLKQQLYEIHGLTSYNFSLAYPATVTAESNYTVTVTFEDHGLNSTTKTVKVKITP